ncbi:MAG: hypothetical protein ACLPLR_05170 [Terriglobales bacterium]
MTVIQVLRPNSKIAFKPDRPVNALLKAQIHHLLEAEKNLPLRHRSDIYVHAIKTEGEAAEYIRHVTEAIHDAHEAAAAKRRRGIAIAAAAEKPVRKRPSAGKSAPKKKTKLEK